MAKFLFIILFFLPNLSFAQFGVDESAIQDDDLQIGGDIFTDFNEDLEDTQILEDERFFRFGRFFSYQLGVGLTTFTGNRGKLFQDDPPSFATAVNFFTDFNSSYGLGIAYSKHSFFLEEKTKGFPLNPALFVDIAILRAQFNYRYYIDTADLGTAITYSNPYFSVRIEYWYMSYKFIDRPELDTQTANGFGLGLGGGLEFPIKLKESYINVEGLWHRINFKDKYTSNYQNVVPDLVGDALTIFTSYVFNW